VSEEWRWSGDVGVSVLGKSGTAGIALLPPQGQTLVAFHLCRSKLGLGNG
jgi:hypothetical protein